MLFKAWDSAAQHFDDLYVVPAAGGSPVSLTANSTGFTGTLTGGAWPPTGTTVVFSGDTEVLKNGQYVCTSEIFTVPATGGAARQLTRDVDGGSKHFPVYSPNGASIAYIWDNGGTYKLAVLPAGGGKVKVLDTNLRKGATLSWSPDGKLITYAKFDATRTYTDIYTVDVKSLRRKNLTNGAFGGAGGPAWAGTVMHPTFSPDGSKIAFAHLDPALAGQGPGDLYVIPSAGGTAALLASDVAVCAFETGIGWSDDGSQIVYPYMELDALGNRLSGLATVTPAGEGATLTAPGWTMVESASFN